MPTKAAVIQSTCFRYPCCLFCHYGEGRGKIFLSTETNIALKKPSPGPKAFPILRTLWQQASRRCRARSREKAAPLQDDAALPWHGWDREGEPGAGFALPSASRPRPALPPCLGGLLLHAPLPTALGSIPGPSLCFH